MRSSSSPAADTAAPRCIYLHGFASSPGSHKARFFADRLRALGVQVTVPDLNAGDFAGLTVSRMLAQVGALLAESSAPAWIVGSSLGGWVASLAAAAEPARVAGLCLLAPAFGMPERWRQKLTLEQLAAWEREGMEVHHHGEGRPLRLRIDFLHDAERHEPYPRVSAPALVLHGVKDDVVPVEASRRFALGQPHVELVEYDSGHELLDVLEPMWSELEARLGPWLRRA